MASFSSGRTKPASSVHTFNPVRTNKASILISKLHDLKHGGALNNEVNNQCEGFDNLCPYSPTVVKIILSISPRFCTVESKTTSYWLNWFSR